MDYKVIKLVEESEKMVVGLEIKNEDDFVLITENRIDKNASFTEEDYVESAFIASTSEVDLWKQDIENGFQPKPLSEAEVLEQWRNSFKVATYKLEIELEERGLMATVQTIIDQSPKSTRIGWQKSPTVRRMSQTVLGLASHPDIALTAEQLDDIFKSADLREL